MVKKVDIKSKVKSVDDLFRNIEENPKSNNNPVAESMPIIESNPNPESMIESNNESEINPNHSTINNPKSKSKLNTKPAIIKAKEKVKYTDIKTQRAFWYDTELINIFDENYPRNKFDKSDIMNQLLRYFLEENGLLKKQL